MKKRWELLFNGNEIAAQYSAEYRTMEVYPSCFDSSDKFQNLLKEFVSTKTPYLYFDREQWENFVFETKSINMCPSRLNQYLIVDGQPVAYYDYNEEKFVYGRVLLDNMEKYYKPFVDFVLHFCVIDFRRIYTVPHLLKAFMYDDRFVFKHPMSTDQTEYFGANIDVNDLRYLNTAIVNSEMEA